MNRRKFVANSVPTFFAASSIMQSSSAHIPLGKNSAGNGRKMTMEARPSPITFDPTETVIIVVDMQNDFGTKGGMLDRAGIDISMIQLAVAPTARVLAAARKAGMKVVYLKMAYKPDLSDLGTADSPNRRLHEQVQVGAKMLAPNGAESRILVRDTWNTDIVNELKPEPADTVIYKSRFSGFYETELDNKLRAMGARYLILTGCTTRVCVESTIRDAMFRDYSPVLLEDCTAEPVGFGLPRSNHEASLLLIQMRLGWVSSSDQFVKSLASSAGHSVVA
jgi:ureidoacrylate peracid hydrolase